MTNLEKIRKNRLLKLKHLEARGFDCFPRQSKRTNVISEALECFNQLAHLQKEVILNGRIVGWRGHGGIFFLDIKDESGKIQALFKKDKLGEKGFKFFQDFFDIGDFVELRGILIKTKTAEKALEIYNFKMLAKSIRPLPEKWHGLQDVEERYRKRYLDLIFNEEIKNKFKTRTEIIKFLRNFLEKQGFMEVETPILQPIYGGARAKPFKTHLNALDIDLYLRISPELYLKRLLVGGFEKVYEIGKCFRNEGVDKAHNPDFTILEFYWAYADCKEMMKLTEKMIIGLVEKFLGKLTLQHEKENINFKTPWTRIEFSQLFKKHTKIDLEEINQAGLCKRAKELGIAVEQDTPKAEIADEIYKKYCRPKIIQPCFILHHPLGFQPLAKRFEKNSSKLANFQLVVSGIELINSFSELNDPVEQGERFKEQEKLFKKGFKEAIRSDKDFLETLEYGMPPAAGFGMGIDRLVALLTDSHNLKEIILFPTMKSKK